MLNKDAQIANLEKEVALKSKEVELAERERDIYKKAFETEKDITDRALKLAENKSSWTQWILPIAIVAIVIAALVAL